MDSEMEKSKVICERVGICWHEEGRNVYGYEAMYIECLHCKGVFSQVDNPNLFTPDGQVVLAKALSDNQNLSTTLLFIEWVEANHLYPKNELQIDPNVFWLSVEAETKLAELFYEFIESEKR